jgi:hypothetical protein
VLSLIAGALIAAGCGGGGANAQVADRPAADQPPYLRLQDRLVGYSLRYPRSWKVKRQAVGGAEFVTGARCASVRVVDFEPPPESGAGGGGFLRHSFVQVCARGLTDRSSLDEFMRQTYPRSLRAQFELAKVGGVRAYTARKRDQTVIFLQTDDYRIQILASVVASPEKLATRRAQVRRILGSFALV